MQTSRIVLIVEFDHQTRVNLRSLVESLGRGVITATTSQGGKLALQTRSEIRLILVSSTLTQVDELIAFKLGSPGAAAIPIVCYGDRDKWRDLQGVTEFAGDPSDLARMSAVLSKYL